MGARKKRSSLAGVLPFKGSFECSLERTLNFYGLQSKLFNFWGSYRVVDTESFNFDSLGFGASEKTNSEMSKGMFTEPLT